MPKKPDSVPAWAVRMDAKLDTLLWRSRRIMAVEGQIIELIMTLTNDEGNAEQLVALKVKLKNSADALKAAVEANQPPTPSPLAPVGDTNG